MATKRFEMSDEHKQALAEGRAQGRAVRAYLEALEADRRTGPRTDPEALQRKIDDVQTQVDSEPDPAKRLELVQKRIDLEQKLAQAEEAADIEQLETDFIDAAAPYSERKGISYTAWRELGVPAAVLKKAGVKRTRKAA